VKQTGLQISVDFQDGAFSVTYAQIDQLTLFRKMIPQTAPKRV
jgi:hypothetical protein